MRQEATPFPPPAIIASGPLTSPALAADIARLTGQEYLYFTDALSPIVSHDSINLDIAFRQSRYDDGEELDGDYLNCPLTRAEYDVFTRHCSPLKPSP
ncbi:MAG: FAD-dependent oxidoreductase [Chloroflexi bacterium]|nr:FAD-dependent oxidoreductase [Chloroflexota bacterium]